MALTEITYTGDGSDVTFGPIPFDYLEATDVKVSLNGVVTTAFTIDPSTKIITFSSAPGDGVSIRVFRRTDFEDLSATFISGSAIRAQDLNDNFNQNLYVTQEISNYAITNDGLVPMKGDLNMGNYRITNLAEPTADSNAATKQYIDTRLGSLDVPGFTRWSLTAVGGETTLSGAGTTGGTLAYSANREQVYLNGAQLQRDADYTANNGTSIVLNVALTAGDVVEVICVNNLNTGTTAQAQDVYWNQSGSGAVTRTVESKLRDVVSVKDFGAVGDGVTDDTAAWQSLVANYPANQITCIVPPGTYTCSAPVTVPKNIQLLFQKGAVIAAGQQLTITNLQAANANDIKVKPAEIGLGYPGDQNEFNYLSVSGNSGAGGNVVAHHFDLVDSSQNVLSSAKGSYSRYSEIRVSGLSASGGFVGTGGFSYQTGALQVNGGFASNLVGVAGYAANLGYSMGGSLGNYQGSVFGSNFYARTDNGATYLSNVTGCEVNTECKTGSSVAYKSGVQIIASDQVSADLYDCGLAVSSKTGATPYNTGILFGAMNGGAPVVSAGSLIGVANTGSWSTTNGINLDGITFTGSAFASNLFRVDGNGNVSVGLTTRVNDAFAPLQLNAQPSEERGVMFDKSGGYGLWIGYVNGSGGKTEGRIRQITSDDLTVVVNNTTEAFKWKSSGIVNIPITPTYADNAAAKVGGLVDGDVYRTATGQLMVVYT